MPSPGPNRRALSRSTLTVLGVVVGGLLLLVAIVVLIKVVPPWVGSTNGLKGKDRAEEIGRARTAVLAILAGTIASIGAVFTGLSYRLNRAGQLTERFTRAIDQVGSASLDVRLGGIYALERIARDSADDHPQVIEVLTAYVREHARWRPNHPQPANAPETPDDSSRALAPPPKPAPDTVAGGTDRGAAETTSK